MKHLKPNYRITFRNCFDLTYSDNDTSFEYSEDVEKLKTVLNDIDITCHLFKYGKHFPEDNEKRYVLVVTIIRNEKSISFEYGMSINDTEILSKQINYDNRTTLPKQKQDVYKNLLYSILCCIGLDYSIDEDYEYFCSEFGYDTDSIKANDLHKRCLAQSRKLKSIFTEEEIASFPS